MFNLVLMLLLVKLLLKMILFPLISLLPLTADSC